MNPNTFLFYNCANANFGFYRRFEKSGCLIIYTQNIESLVGSLIGSSSLFSTPYSFTGAIPLEAVNPINVFDLTPLDQFLVDVVEAEFLIKSR